MRAADLGKRGDESPAELEADMELRDKLEAIRLAAGRSMNLGDVTRKNVPKMCLVSPPAHGGAIATRSFIPHRVHSSIGVLGAISVATACALPGSVAAEFAAVGRSQSRTNLDIEHPTGFFTVETLNSVYAGHQPTMPVPKAIAPITTSTAPRPLDANVHAAGTRTIPASILTARSD